MSLLLYPTLTLSSKTILSLPIPSRISILKRFMRKDVGHVYKILRALPKVPSVPPLPPVPPVAPVAPSPNPSHAPSTTPQANTPATFNSQLNTTKTSVNHTVTTAHNHQQAAQQATATINKTLGLIPPSILISSDAPHASETKINASTTSDTITIEELKNEMLNRKLIKVNSGNTAVKLKLQDDSNYLLGETKHGIKLTPKGHAYATQIESKDKLNHQSEILPSGVSDNASFIIIVPPRSNDDLFIEDAKQKHLIVIHNTLTGRYFAVCYFTSKTSSEFLSKQQFKPFQEQQEKNLNTETQFKEQHCVYFENPIEIKEEDIKRVKWDKEYLDSLPKTSKDFLYQNWHIIKGNPVLAFNKSGLTIEDCIKMCLEHDNTILQNKKHPLTEDQIKQNLANKKKQEEMNKLKKSKNEESTIIN